MLTSHEKVDITAVINSSLDRAEKHWAKGGSKLVSDSIISMNESMFKAESQPSKIPGHETVQDEETVVDEFIALVADMRESSKHLMCAISKKSAQVTGLERVYYETSALLPAMAKTINFKSGSVTEYLGDGVLALYRVDPKDKSESIYSAHRSAKNIIGDTRTIINNILKERYSLPEINIGVGLALSKTLVTLVGLDGEKHPKAIGECVFRATKLSSGINQIYSDDNLKNNWPSSKSGTISFREKTLNSVKGFLIEIGK